MNVSVFNDEAPLNTSDPIATSPELKLIDVSDVQLANELFARTLVVSSNVFDINHKPQATITHNQSNLSLSFSIDIKTIIGTDITEIEKDQDKYRGQSILNIVENADDVRKGNWRGQDQEVLFYIFFEFLSFFLLFHL